MPIKVANFAIKPALAYDEVHLDNLSISLTQTQQAKARVVLRYSMFARDAEGIKDFGASQPAITIEDAYVTATENAMQGDMVLAGALQAIEAAVAQLITALAAHGTATVE